MRPADLHRWLVPRVVVPLGARLGQRMWTEARRLGEFQWLSAGAIEARNAERLRRLVSHAADHVPFYRERLKQAGVNDADLRTAADLSRLPIVTKSDLRPCFPAGTTADNLPEQRRQAMATSGSTGMPFEFYWDRAAADMVRGTYLFWLQWAGTAVWDARIAIASPAYFYNQVAPVARWRRWAGRLILGEESVSLSSDTLSTARFRGLVREVSSRKRYFVRGYPAPIAGLAAHLLEESEPLAGYPQVVITFAETLTPANASTIHTALRCRVVNYYSSWEIPQMAQTCPDNPDLLHVNADRVILRVVRPDGSEAAAGETGRVVVTDLANYVMPFINYANGDQAVAGDVCPCGRGLPTLVRLEGRDSEVIRNLQGREINGVVLGQFLAFVAGAIPSILEYQALQTSADFVRLLVIPTDRFSAALGEKLRGDLEEFIGPGMRVEIEAVDRIPLEASGKRLLVKRLDGERRDEPAHGGA